MQEMKLMGETLNCGVHLIASPKCSSRAFIMLKFLEAERVMNKKLNEYVKR